MASWHMVRDKGMACLPGKSNTHREKRSNFDQVPAMGDALCDLTPELSVTANLDCQPGTTPSDWPVGIFLSLVDVGEPSPLWEVLSLGRWPWTKKVADCI